MNALTLYQSRRLVSMPLLRFEFATVVARIIPVAKNNDAEGAARHKETEGRDREYPSAEHQSPLQVSSVRSRVRSS